MPLLQVYFERGVHKSMHEKRDSKKHSQEPARSWPGLPRSRQFDDASAMFRALGQPSRLRLLARLATRDACVSELAELEAQKLTTISAQLMILHAAGLVKRRREAKNIYYALSHPRVLRLVENAISGLRR